MSCTTDEASARRTHELYERHCAQIHRRTSHNFAVLLAIQWLAALVFTLIVSPRTWSGAASAVHPHVWLALGFGGALTGLAILVALAEPALPRTRFLIATTQALMSALLIHLTGGRIETHFHVFGSLAFLAFYRDARVLFVTAGIVAADHVLRGWFFPMSVYGVAEPTFWRAIEHGGWVAFEVIFLTIAVRQAQKEMLAIAERQARLEAVNQAIEDKVAQRTEELARENAERQRTEKDLQKSEERFRTMAQNIDEVFWLGNADVTELYYVSPAYETVWGRSLASLEADPRSWLEGIVPEDRERLLGDMAEIANGEHRVDDYRLRRPGGSVRWIRTRTSPVRDRSGAITRLCGVVTDVTASKQAELQLRQLSRAIECSPTSIVITDRAGRIEYVNTKFTEVTGYSADEVRGQNPRILNSGRTSADVFAGMWETILAGREWHGELQNRRKDGEVFWEFASISGIRDDTGAITHFVAVKEDISERKQTEEKLETARRQLLDVSRQAGMAEVATSVLHNVGNVLNSANVSLEVASKRVRDLKASSLHRTADLLHENAHDLPSFFATSTQGARLPAFLTQLAEYFAKEQLAVLAELESLRKNVEHINEIVAMQQSYASGGGVVEVLPLAAVVEDAMRMNLDGLDRHGVTLVRDFDPSLSAAPIDRHKVLQILVNLIRNAKIAMDDPAARGHTLTLRTSRNGGDCFRIEVIDEGTGIAPENVMRIFQHGFTTRKGGHGFGLHSSALSAKEMGGTLRAHSDGPGRGATFTLELPLRSQDP